jgi:Ni,Fe-hydrogenase III small subunit
MSLTGNLTDIALVDLLQFVHLSARSGTLHIERDQRQAHISFHRGKIVTAWSPASPSVCDLLVVAGVLTREKLEEARRKWAKETPPPPLGRVLVETGAVSREALRDAICRKVEQTIYDLVGWTRGKFCFVVDEVRPDDEVALAPGDVIPEADVNTQMVLMEALRLFDERNAASPPQPAAPEPAMAPVPAPVDPRPAATVHVVTRDEAFATAVQASLRTRADVRRVPLIDAGVAPPGQLSPICVVDMRPGQTSGDAIRRIAAQHARAPMIAVIGPGVPPAIAIADGAVSALPAEPSTIAAAALSLISARGPAAGPDDDLRTGLARLRRVLGDLRSGLLSATVSLNLMTIVADSVERAILFVARGNQFVALGAFGALEDGRPLAETSHGISLRLGGDGPIAAAIADGHARIIDYGPEALPPELLRAVDCPRYGQAVVFPVLGTHKVIALIYADNGRRLRPISDVEIVEIATSQVGLAFENELLRRQLHRR